MMTMEETRASSGPNERRAGERRMNHVRSSEREPFEGGTAFIEDTARRGDDGMSRVSEAGMSDRRGMHSLVTFWTPDGSRHAGMAPRVNGEMIFIESKRMVPVDTDITVSLAPVEKQSDGQELAEGTVVWHCPRPDQFERQGGFGVRLKRRWPKGPGLVGGPKELV